MINETINNFSIFADLVEVKRNCEQCDASFNLKVPRAKQSGGPKLCDKCALQKAADIDRRRLFDAVPELIMLSGISKAYNFWNDDTAQDKGSDKLLEWLKERQEQSVWIGGTNGIGKTHAVMYMALSMIKYKAISVKAVRCSYWLRQQSTLRTGDWRDRAKADAEFKRAAQVQLLILDDIGKEKVTETKAELLYDLVDIRERDKLRIWVTTNQGGKLLRSRLNAGGAHDHGDAILSRLVRMIPAENIIGGAKK